MKLIRYINGLKKEGLKDCHFEKASIKLENGVRIVYNTIDSGESSGIDDLNCIIAYNSDKILNSVKIDRYNDESNDIKVWLDFLNKYRNEEVESFSVVLNKSNPSTKIRLYKQRNMLNAIDYVTTISDSILLE